MPLLQGLERFLGSLRIQLTLWNTSVVLVAVLVAMFAVREGLRISLLRELEELLHDESKALILAIQHMHPDQREILDELHRFSLAHKEHGWFVAWLELPDHTPLYQSPHTPRRSFKQLSSTQDYRVWGDDQYRILEVVIPLMGSSSTLLRIGSPLAFIDRDVQRLTQVLLPITLGLLIAAPFGGYLLATRATSPLQRIIATTRRLRPSQMSERLPVRAIGDELDQLAEQINHFLDQMAGYLRKQQEFIANAAHELRSPLTAIQASVEVALDKPRSVAEYEDLLQTITLECQHLTHLVNQLLQLTAAEGDQTLSLFESVDLTQLAQQAVEIFGPVAEERCVELRADLQPACLVRGNPYELRQLLTNLIDNSLKFTPAQGIVTLHIERCQNGLVALRISDTGVGIPAEDLPRIFDRFYQVDKTRSRGQSQRGYGLGLSICRAIVEKHGGQINVSSQPGHGTTFIIELRAPDD